MMITERVSYGGSKKNLVHLLPFIYARFDTSRLKNVL